MRTIFSILFTFCIGGLLAQGITISGRIVDAETLDPLPFAHIFIDQTTIVTVSDTNGEYVLEHVEDGEYKIVFSFVGYEMYFATASVRGEDIRLSARLVPTKEMLESVEVRGSKDKEWEKQLKQFNRVFFGDNEFAKDCKVLNPWVLDFRIDWDKTFIASASGPLEIENKAFGYNIQCTLQGFSFDKKGYKIKGLYKFEEINTLDKKEAAKWTRNRKLAYQNSLRFLFKSMLDNHETENGFKLYNDLRPSLYTPTSGYFANEYGKTITDYKSKDHIQPAGRPGQYKISVPERLEIHHTTQFGQSKAYRDMPHPVSWIEVEKGYILVSQDGNSINNEHLVTAGELYNNRIGAMLPLNYSPGALVVINYITKRARAKRLQERVYLQTDKGMYYPGETVWLKAYTNYANQSIRDSLSRVLYVDLIDPAKKVIESKKLSLDSAYAWSEFELPGDFISGLYHIRAYTKWMLNYGSEIIFNKPILVLPKTLAVNSDDFDQSNDDFIVSFSKNRFKWPGSIEVTAILDSNSNNSVANCSISVSPVKNQLPSFANIHDALFFPDEMPEGTLADFIHELEYGFSVQGQLYRKNKKNTTGSVTVIQGKMDSIYHLRTDRRGNFKIQNLDFQDTTTMAFQAKDRKGRIVGNIRLIERETPRVELPKINFRKIDFDTLTIDYPLLITTNSTRDSVAHEKSIEAQSRQSTRLISNADYFLGPAELERIPSGTNIIDALLVRVPGLTSNAQTGTLSFRNRGSSNNNNEPLVVVDGVPVNLGGGAQSGSNTDMGSATNQIQQSVESQSSESNKAKESVTSGPNQIGNTSIEQKYSPQGGQIKARDMVGHITVEFVSKVEINLNGDARYGAGSSNGVISIFTQKMPRNKPVNSIETFIIDGYAKPKPFVQANLLSIKKTYNPLTLYWNPSIDISPTEPIKFSFDSPAESGQYLLRIEGMTPDGKPVSGSVIFNLEKHADQTKARF